MKFATVVFGDRQRVARLAENAEEMILLDPAFTQVTDLIGKDLDALAEDARVPAAEVRLLAPVPRPVRNILCVGKNYHAHAKEFARSGYEAGATTDVDEYPALFSKLPTSVIGPDDEIELHPAVTQKVDYEAELAVIIGPGGRDIAKSDAYAHVWGYTILNDVTARDLQRDHKQWFHGKSLDTFAPMGPWIVTADEVDPENLQVTCHVNGELRQDANTRDLIHDIPTLIATLSAGTTLVPGDIIATGTPAGVGIGMDPPRFLQPGDVVRVAITGLGELTNTCAPARSGTESAAA